MIALKQIDPPALFKPEGIGEPVIGVRIMVSADVLSPCFFPAHNRIGGDLLLRLLKARIELAGVKVTEFCHGFELNRSAFMFTVSSASELAAAQQAVKDELEILGLLEFAQIAWYDTRELIWRVFRSATGRFDWVSEEELAVESVFIGAITEAVKKHNQQEK